MTCHLSSLRSRLAAAPLQAHWKGGSWRGFPRVSSRPQAGSQSPWTCTQVPSGTLDPGPTGGMSLPPHLPVPGEFGMAAASAQCLLAASLHPDAAPGPGVRDFHAAVLKLRGVQPHPPMTWHREQSALLSTCADPKGTGPPPWGPAPQEAFAHVPVGDSLWLRKFLSIPF